MTAEVVSLSDAAARLRHPGNGGPPIDDPSLLGGPDDPTGLDNLRYLGRLDPRAWGTVTLGQSDGEPMRDWIAAWIGRPAIIDTDVAAGVARLAHMIEVSTFHGPGWPAAPRLLIRVALCGIGLYPPVDPELSSDTALDEWIALLLLIAGLTPGDYRILEHIQ
jgi:hypothetical protein